MIEPQPTEPLSDPAPSRRKRFRGCAGIVLACVVLFVTLIAVTAYSLLHTTPLRISKETTYITGPLKSDGKQVDYFAAWEQLSYPPELATDDNGFRLIVQHFGPSSDTTPERFAVVCQKLGLDENAIEPDEKLQDPYDFIDAYVKGPEFDGDLVDRLQNAMEEDAERSEKDEYEFYEPDPSIILMDRIDRPWTLDDVPMMEAWLSENEAGLETIHQAVRKPVYHVPLVRESENTNLIILPIPEVHRQRAFARALHVRAYYRIGTGDIDGAIDDIVACKRLGRLVGYHGMMIQMLVGIAIEGIADSIGIAESLEHPPTKQQLERLVTELDNLPPVGDVKHALLFERFCALDIIQSMAHGTTSFTELDIPSWTTRIGFDWNVIAQRMNTRFDNMSGNGAAPQPKASPRIVFSRRARSELMADTLSALLTPALDAATETTRRRECSERMRRISLAMLLYEADHGMLPPAFTVDADGNPLHSWRVLLLPYLGQRALYDRIHLDEPWDSQHNRTLHDEAIPFYQCPSAGLSPGQTTYCVVTGPEMPFESGVGKKLADFGPKSATMILVVERTQSACWMDPASDVPQEVADAGINVSGEANGGIGSPHPGGANFGLRNGACHFISQTVDRAIFPGMLRGTVDTRR